MSDELNALIALDIVEMISQALLRQGYTGIGYQQLESPLRYALHYDNVSVNIRVRDPLSDINGVLQVKEDAQPRVVIASNNTHSRSFIVRKDNSIPLQKMVEAADDAFISERRRRDTLARCIETQRQRNAEIQALNARYSLPEEEGAHPAYLKIGDDYGTIGIVFPNLTTDQARALLVNADRLGLLTLPADPEEVKRPSQWDRLKAACPIAPDDEG